MEKYAVPNKLPSKQVSILAHRRKRINQSEARAAQKKQGRRVKKFTKFLKPERLVAEFRKAERDNNRMRRVVEVHSCRPTAFIRDASQKLAVVFRHRGNYIASEKLIETMRKLRISRKYHARLVRLTPKTERILAAIEPYVSWGYPNINTVRDLVFKYGYTKTKGKKVAISSNVEVEKALGEHNVICIEDMVHELFTVGPHFDEVNNYLCTFVLQAPKSGWEKSRGLHFVKGGECGFRGDAINDLFQEVL